MTLHAAADIACAAPAWLADAYESFHTELAHPAYPCYFGTQADREGFLRFSTVDPDDLAGLAEDLRVFTELSRANPHHRHVLVSFFEQDPGGVPASAELFWRCLQWLHDHDPAPWPSDVPDMTNDPAWEFCFNGDAMFAFPVIPSYRLRRSRGLGSNFALCFQPRRIFAGVNRDDPGGEPIRRHIYDRVREWDSVPPHPELEMLAYGDGDMREWRQYVLPDSNTELLGRCPIRTETARGYAR